MKRQLKALIQRLLNFFKHAPPQPQDTPPLYYYGREVYAANDWDYRP